MAKQFEAFELGINIKQVGEMLGVSRDFIYKKGIIAKLEADGVQSFEIAGQKRFLATSVANIMQRAAATGKPIGDLKRRGKTA